MGVRRGLAQTVPFLDECPGIEVGMAELVLAEVLNNIVEHGGEGALRGAVELRLVRCRDCVRVTVADEGRPVPSGVILGAALPGLEPSNLPEGGFGWGLIALGTEALRYRRWNGRNVLCFRLVAKLAA